VEERALDLEARTVLELVSIGTAGSGALSGLLIKSVSGGAANSNALSVDFLEVSIALGNAHQSSLLVTGRAVNLLASVVDEGESSRAVDSLALGADELGSLGARNLNARVSLDSGASRAASEDALVSGDIEVRSSRASGSDASLTGLLESFGARRNLEADAVLLDGVLRAVGLANSVDVLEANIALDGVALAVLEHLTSRTAGSDALTVGELEELRA
jgi:hypothetical protein